MPKETATLALTGRVSLEEFAVAVQQFQQIMQGLTESVAATAGVEWELAALEYGSALIAVRGTAEKRSAVASVITAYERVGKSVQGNKSIIPFSPRVQRSVRKLCGLLGGEIESIRFETDDFDAEIVSPTLKVYEPANEPVSTYGAAEGRIQSMTNRRGLRFTLYDLHDDRAVSCYLREGCEDAMRDSWGKMAIVEGMVRRDPVTGRIATVRDIGPENIEILESDGPESWRDAIGCAPAISGSISAEESIRRGRE